MATMSRIALLALLGALLLVGLVGQSMALAKVDEEQEGIAFDEDSSDGEGDVEEVVDEKDVFVLGSEDFADFVKSNQYVLVEFYAPWCGHCQSLTPQYAKAATKLKDSGVKLAKVDATVHNELAEEYGVDGYPTLFLFIDGEKKPYTGGRSSDQIITWLKKRTGPAASIVKSLAEADELLKSETPIAVAYLDSAEGADAKEFLAAARLLDGVRFCLTSDERIAKKFGLDSKAPALVLLKTQNEKVATFGGSFKRKALGDFVLENKLPLVVPFTRETSDAIFESDVPRQLLLFANPDEFDRFHSNYEEAAKYFKRKITFLYVNRADEDVATPILEFFSLDNEKMTIMGFHGEESNGKYLYEGDFSVESLKQFSEKFVAGDLVPVRKSENAPEENNGPVKIVVTSTFEQIVLDESKDVLLEIYAPWCGHCQSLEPEYNKLGEALTNISSIVIAKMDGTKNEHERLKIEGYPTIFFFPAGDKNAEPISLDTERTAASFIKFMKQHATHPFEAPDVPEPEPEPESDYSEDVEEESEGEEGDDEGGEVEGESDEEGQEGDEEGVEEGEEESEEEAEDEGNDQEGSPAGDVENIKDEL